MKNIQFPVQFTFKIGTLSNDFLVEDAMGNDIGYVRQKMLKMVDEVVVYDNDLKSNILFTIKANKWIDFSATYTFTNHLGQEIGRIGRKGWASIWKARYEIFDEKANQDLLIQEENGWIKVADAVLSEIPILGLFTGYLFNPSYIVTRPDGTEVIRLKKQPSLVGRRFLLEKLNNFEPGEEERVILGLMMMILMERRRG
ncbi:hypothetical protein [Haliscomenobacter sp.]|jgi:hypothetical protein|uniref:hypothetical protein n=1 Tax=Haliscomenobacter sp. TaxID=2717303 RepID=UPI003BA96E1E